MTARPAGRRRGAAHPPELRVMAGVCGYGFTRTRETVSDSLYIRVGSTPAITRHHPHPCVPVSPEAEETADRPQAGATSRRAGVISSAA